MTTITATARNTLTGDQITLTVPAWGWRTAAKEAAALRWGVCWDSITLEQTTDDFTAHVALIRAERPDMDDGAARFAAWQEGPGGLARRQMMPPTNDRAPTIEDLAEAAQDLHARNRGQ